MFRRSERRLATTTLEESPDRSMQVLEFAVAFVAGLTAILLAFVH
ncbi:MAG: hypothetical protein ACJ761_02575 [Chloroflexota bacterium]